MSSGKVSICEALGLETKAEVGPLFRVHQDNQVNSAITKLEEDLAAKIEEGLKNHHSDNRVEALGDLIMAELGIQKVPQSSQMQALDLNAQFSSDFISFTNLQREIDEQCLRPLGQEQSDEVSQILDDMASSQTDKLCGA